MRCRGVCIILGFVYLSKAFQDIAVAKMRQDIVKQNAGLEEFRLEMIEDYRPGFRKVLQDFKDFGDFNLVNEHEGSEYDQEIFEINEQVAEKLVKKNKVREEEIMNVFMNEVKKLKESGELKEKMKDIEKYNVNFYN